MPNKLFDKARFKDRQRTENRTRWHMFDKAKCEFDPSAILVEESIEEEDTIKDFVFDVIWSNKYLITAFFLMLANFGMIATVDANDSKSEILVIQLAVLFSSAISIALMVKYMNEYDNKN